jgi:NADH dehydrogenase (ubiquinone) 1 alpha subcomplex subunit 8
MSESGTGAGVAGAAPQTHYLALLCAAPMVGDECLEHNAAFMLCKQQDNNPAKCVHEGEKVTACTLKVLRKAEEQCDPSYKAFQLCLRDNARRFYYCQEQQKAFEACMGYKR